MLEAERQLDLKRWPERYDHIWEGGYAKAFEGAYFASVLNAAKAEGRIGSVAPIRCFRSGPSSISVVAEPPPTPWRSGSSNGSARKFGC